MTREEYMIKLKKYLRKLPKQDYEDAIEYFKELLRDNPNNTEINNLILELEKNNEF